MSSSDGIRAEIDAAPVYEPAQSEEPEALPDNVAEGQGAARDILVDLAVKIDLWHDPDRNTFATIPVSGHNENWQIKSKTFRHWLTGHYYALTKKAPPAQALTDAMATIEARAVFEGSCHETALRIGQLDGVIYLDLGDTSWQAVKITANDWHIIDEPPVKFIRSSGMRSLPIPSKDGGIEVLRKFLNLASEYDFVLYVSFLMASLQPAGPYPILVLNGQQGSAKSTTARVTRQLVDPYTPEIRSVPREERDLVAAARHNWLLPFDNLSGVPGWLSDSLCRLATGGGLGGRRLYTDFEEAAFEAQRPILINGIPDLATRGDLADRAIVLTLPVISEAARKDEARFWAEFNAARPQILGALLDGISCAIKRRNDIQFAQLPRMADFAIWATAAEPAFGWTEGTFIAAYEANRLLAAEIAVEADSVAVVITEIISQREKTFNGTASELLTLLNGYVSDDIRRHRNWPKDAARLGTHLRKVAPSLRLVGVDVHVSRKNTVRNVSISKRPKNAVTAVTAVNNPANQPLNGDGIGDSDGIAASDTVTPNILKTNNNDSGDGSDSKSSAFSPTL